MEANARNIVYMLDDTGKIIFINDTIYQYGYSPNELIGKNIMDIFLFHNKQKTNGKRTALGKKKSCEIWLIKKDKTVVPVEIKSMNIESAQIFTITDEECCVSTILLGKIGIASDVTENRSPYLLATNNNEEKILKASRTNKLTIELSSRGYWEDIKKRIGRFFNKKNTYVSHSRFEDDVYDDDNLLKEYYDLVNK